MALMFHAKLAIHCMFSALYFEQRLHINIATIMYCTTNSSIAEHACNCVHINICRIHIQNYMLTNSCTSNFIKFHVCLPNTFPPPLSLCLSVYHNSPPTSHHTLPPSNCNARIQQHAISFCTQRDSLNERSVPSVMVWRQRRSLEKGSCDTFRVIVGTQHIVLMLRYCVSALYVVYGWRVGLGLCATAAWPFGAYAFVHSLK